jgi:hypothetical protein
MLKVYSVCVVKNNESDSLFRSYPIENINIQIEFISELYHQLNQTDSLNCSVIIKFLKIGNNNYYHNMNHQCPGICLPIPYVELPLDLLYPPFITTKSLTCSLTLSAVISHHPNHFSAKINNQVSANKSIIANFDNQFSANISSTAKIKLFEIILASVSRRRMEECSERVVVVVAVVVIIIIIIIIIIFFSVQKYFYLFNFLWNKLL